MHYMLFKGKEQSFYLKLHNQYIQSILLCQNPKDLLNHYIRGKIHGYDILFLLNNKYLDNKRIHILQDQKGFQQIHL
jgi:hypothetical protein